LKLLSILFHIVLSSMITVSFISADELIDPKLPVSGILFEKMSDGSSGPPLTGVQIEFKNRQRGFNIQVRTNSYGRYYALLPYAEYEMVIHHRNYIVNKADFSCRPRQYTNPNAYRSRNMKAPSKFDEYGGYDNYIPDLPMVYPKEAPGAPEVEISVEPAKVKVNEPFYVKVSAKDDKGLAAIWWFAEVATETELLEPKIFDCAGETETYWIWEVRVAVAGSLALSADAVDQEYSDENKDAIHKASDARKGPVVFVKITNN